MNGEKWMVEWSGHVSAPTSPLLSSMSHLHSIVCILTLHWLIPISHWLPSIFLSTSATTHCLSTGSALFFSRPAHSLHSFQKVWRSCITHQSRPIRVRVIRYVYRLDLFSCEKHFKKYGVKKLTEKLVLSRGKCTS